MPHPDDLDDATLPQDAPSDDESTPRPKTAREVAMEALEANHLKRLEEESGVKLTEDDLLTDDQLRNQLAEEPPSPAPAPVQAPVAAAEVIEDVAGKKVRVKIDGVEQEVGLEDVLRSYQKGSAADRRLEEATLLLKQVKEQAQQQPAQPPQQEPAVTPPSAGPDDLKTAVQSALGHLYRGDEELAAAELAEVMARSARNATPQAPAIDVDQIATQLQQRMDVQNALLRVQTDYPDIYGSDDLQALTLMKVKAREAEGVPRSQAILDAANDVYTLLGKKPGRQEPPAPTPRDQKLARKAALEQIQAANVTESAGIPDADESPSAVIAAMAAKRLGQSMPGR